jgi:hypothetical protein
MAEAAEQSVQDLNSGTKPVDPRHAIDEAKLAAWLDANVEGYAGPLAASRTRPISWSRRPGNTSCAASRRASCCPAPTPSTASSR